MSIKIERLEKQIIKESTNTFKYKDIFFDLVEDETPETKTLYSKVTNTDLRYRIDEGAIMNSIKNIFTTKPGQKILNPEFGLDLSQWLFEPVSEMRAREIGEAIHEGISKFERRVTLKHVTVLTYPEDNSYKISMALIIPALNISKEYPAVLKAPGFDFLTNNND